MKTFTSALIFLATTTLNLVHAAQCTYTPDNYSAMESCTKLNILKLGAAIELFKLDNGRYPTQEEGLNILIPDNRNPPVSPYYKQGGYVLRLPVDAWGNLYKYKLHEYSPTIYSTGADGIEGGTKENRDIYLETAN